MDKLLSMLSVEEFGCLEIFLSVIFEKSGLEHLIIGGGREKLLPNTNQVETPKPHSPLILFDKMKSVADVTGGCQHHTCCCSRSLNMHMTHSVLKLLLNCFSLS
jgi:hypothetical protein